VGVVEIKVALQTKRRDKVEVENYEEAQRALEDVREDDGAIKTDVAAVFCWRNAVAKREMVNK